MNISFLNKNQQLFINTYASLISQVGTKEMSTVLKFCNLFHSDNIELYTKFKNSNQTPNDIINIYAEMHGLDPQRDIDTIEHIFEQNVFSQGVSYHLNNSANLENILNLGLGISSIGLKTEERKDKEKLKELVKPKVLKKLQPYYESEHEGNKGKVFFSAHPILTARYGKMPEWIQELKSNYNVFKDDPEYPIDNEAKYFIESILQKYNDKYTGKPKMLFILPYSGIVRNRFDYKNCSLEQIIQNIYNNVLGEKDNSTTKYIPGSSIISIDLKNGDMYVSDRENGIIRINPQEHAKKYEEQKNYAIQLSSEYDMREVSIGNTGQMYEVKDRENGREYYFKPAISKRGETRPYRAHIQEAAYRIQQIINPGRAVQCNTIEIEGMFGAIQEKVEIDFEATKAFREYFNEDKGYLSEELYSKILDEYLVDFCLCNYDAHERNFIIDQNGNLRGIDKEQSFRYIDKDTDRDPMFSNNYNAKYGENPPIYNKIFEDMKSIKIPNRLLDRLTKKAKILSEIPDDEYRSIFGAYAYGKCATPEAAQILLDNILDRKRNIQKSIEQLSSVIQQKRDYFYLQETGLTETEFDEYMRESDEAIKVQDGGKSWDTVIEKYETIKSQHKLAISPKSVTKNALEKGTTTEQANQARSIEYIEQSKEHILEGETQDDK